MQQGQHNSIRAAWIRIGCAVVILSAALLVWNLNREQKKDLYDVEVIAPTCTENGYSLYYNRQTGETTVSDIVTAPGHHYGQWATVQQSDGITPTIRKRVCSACKTEEFHADYPSLSVPQLILSGSLNGIGKKNEVPVTARFQDKLQSRSFECYATLKYQGHESLSYDKKNFTLKFFTDEARDEKAKMVFSHWNPENKYILKANYIDPSSCRNLVCADIWADICAGRAQLSPELAELSNYGAVDGFPIALYINDSFHGLYTMNLHKDDDLFGMKDGQRQAIMISNHTAADEAFFRSPALFSDDSPWEVEYCGTEDSQWAKEQLNALISFICNADDETFRKDLQNHLNVESAIDYLIAMYALGLTSNGASDLVLVSYDCPWILSLYDMEDAFGLTADGSGYYSPTEFLPLKNAGGWDSATGSLLWDRLLNSFENEIRVRYARLRQSVLDTDTLCTRVETFIAAIPTELYEAEQARNGGITPGYAQQEQITNYIRQRMAALDLIFG